MKQYLAVFIATMTVAMIALAPKCATAELEPFIVYQQTNGDANQIYSPNQHRNITLAGTEKMNDAIVGDVDGDDIENELVYTNSSTGQLGYYEIAGDGKWHPENDHAVPNTPSDAVPLCVVRVGYAGTPGVIVYRSMATGMAFGVYPDGTATTALGEMERAYAVDARGLGVKGDILWYRTGAGMSWREGPTGLDHADPFGNLIPIGSGAVVPNQPTRNIVFLVYGANVIYCCDKDWNYTAIVGANWPWCLNTGSMLIADADNDSVSELIFSESLTDALSYYNAPANGYPWETSGVFTDSNINPGSNLRGVAYVDNSLPTAARVGEIRNYPDGTQVELIDVCRTKQVWENDAQGNASITGFYVEETDRSAGIRVMGFTNEPTGRILSLQGTLQTVNGERVIVDATQIPTTTTFNIRPLGMTIKSLCALTTTVGLLVRLTGPVVSADTTNGFLMLSDGSQQTVKVICPGANISSGFLSVTGCVGTEIDGNGNTVHVLRADSSQPQDITLITGGRDKADEVGYTYCICSSLEKFGKNDPMTSTLTAKLTAARNEHEEFQIVLRGGETDSKGLSVAVHDLTGAAGTISAANVKVYVPWYINLPYYNREVADPLPAYNAPFDLAAGQTKILWIDVSVPKTAASGNYSSRISITNSSGTTEVPFNLHIYDFTLPDESKLITQFDFYDYYMAPKEGVTYGSAACKDLWKQYYEFLLQRGISTAIPPAGDFFGTEMANYLKDPRLTSFRMPYDPNPTKQASYFNQARSLGVWDKAFCNTGDEPYSQTDYENYKTRANYYHSVDSSAQCIVAYYSATPAWAAPQHTTDILSGYANIWCPIGGNAFEADRLAARKAVGEKVWMYTCTSPDGIGPNYFLQDPAISHRVIPWECYLHEASGWLYWHTNYWNDVSDPWIDICTGKLLGPQLYGEGSLLYPGKVHTGVAGPVSSIRLELFRDGLEDYKYLWLLQQKIGRAGVMSYVQKIAQSWASYTKDGNLFQSVRDEIAKKIED